MWGKKLLLRGDNLNTVQKSRVNVVVGEITHRFFFIEKSSLDFRAVLMMRGNNSSNFFLEKSIFNFCAPFYC